MNFKKLLNQHKKFYLDKLLDENINKYLYDSFKGKEYEMIVLYDFDIHKFVIVNASIGHNSKGNFHLVTVFTILDNDKNIRDFQKYKKWAKKILEDKIYISISILKYLENYDIEDVAIYVRNKKILSLIKSWNETNPV